MSRITLSIPDELKSRLDQQPEINWTEIFRTALQDKIKQLKLLEKLIAGGKI
jgi:metal-responsive CopG/Arc/MetJ family transcriptional regulator